MRRTSFRGYDIVSSNGIQEEKVFNPSDEQIDMPGIFSKYYTYRVHLSGKTNGVREIVFDGNIKLINSDDFEFGSLEKLTLLKLAQKINGTQNIEAVYGDFE
jgi:hypothetical protein